MNKICYNTTCEVVFIETLKLLLLLPLLLWVTISTLFFFLAYCIMSLRYGTRWFSLFKAADQTLEFQDRLLMALRLFFLRISMKLRIRNRTYMKTVTIYTDGACSGNPGPGGWGAILMYGPHKREISGGEANTTNNRMELTAVISALELLKEPCQVELWSDSKYVIDALEKGWAKGWRARGWVKSDKKPALNPDLWERLLDLCDTHTVRTHWVKGHAENPYNNRCDEMAVAESQKYK